MIKIAVILLFAACNFWFAVNIVRLENYRYANSLGMCSGSGYTNFVVRETCLNKLKLRTHWLYTLAYGLRIL